ncbi:hypothetical protein EVA_02050 [gut metagenome]|uniref:DUF4988 domain-containing protein n=1 Tax=gut metagenome TaxID=749906 RepID=J9GNW1_9ZZZZ
MKKFWMYSCMLLAVMLAGCEDIDKLEDDIHALEDRVTALEEKVKPINDNVKALVEIYKAGVITSIEEKTDGHYTLTLSNGKTVELAKWVEGFGSVPMVGVSSEGNWQVSYDKGTTWKAVLKDGKPVTAVGNGGKAPQFKVDANGYWEVDADGDGTFEQVKDVNGQPVKAIYDPEGPVQELFERVTPKDGLLEIVLKNGETLNIPIVPDFYCYFDESIQGEQAIQPGKTKKYKVHLKGADHTVITAPMGWKAVLGAPNKQFVAELTLTAPKGKVEAAVRATADNLRDVSILAFKGSFVTVAKMQVNAIKVDMGETDTPEEPAKSSLIVPQPTGTIKNIGKYSSTNRVVDSGWFQREGASVTTLTADREGIHAQVAKDKGAWNHSSFGYHTSDVFLTGIYQLTFQVKADAASSVGIGIRTADDDKGFRMLKPDGTNFERNVTTPKIEKANTWVEITQLFDFGFASTAMTSSATGYTSKETATTFVDLQGLSIYFYNNQPHTTIVVKDIKLTKMQ